MSAPIELNTAEERGAALDALLSARTDDCSPISTLARIFDAVNRLRTRASDGQTEIEWRGNLGQGTLVPMPSRERAQVVIDRYGGGAVERREVTKTPWVPV